MRYRVVYEARMHGGQTIFPLWEWEGEAFDAEDARLLCSRAVRIGWDDIGHTADGKTFSKREVESWPDVVRGYSIQPLPAAK